MIPREGCITTIATVDRICHTIAASFDRLIPLYYNRDDRARGLALDPSDAIRGDDRY
jgi:hypothetical protein